MSFLGKITSRYVQLLSEVLTVPFTELVDNLGFILSSPIPNLFVVVGDSFLRSLQSFGQIPFQIASEIALEASDRLSNKKLRQRVMPLDNALKMVFRMGAEKFKDSVTWNAPPIIAFALNVKSLVGDSLLKRLIKRFGGLIGGLFTRSWSLIWFMIERAIRLAGAFFFLVFWALLADYIVENVGAIAQRYCFQQGTPRKRFRIRPVLEGRRSIYRRVPGGSTP